MTGRERLLAELLLERFARPVRRPRPAAPEVPSVAGRRRLRELTDEIDRALGGAS